MSTFRKIDKREDKTDINISPMIDMVFILLIFFIVTTVFVEETGLDVDKPTPAPPDQQQDNPDEPIMFRITQNNQIVFDGNVVPVSRVESLVKTGLSRANVPVILQVERGAFAGLMVQVLDRARIGGADRVSVTAVD